MAPAREPNTNPVTMMRNVHGFMFGSAANGIREAAVMAASMPISATSFDDISASSKRAKMTPMMNSSITKEMNAA